MSFKKRTITWQGKPYDIAPNRIMGAIQRIENYITRNRIIKGLSADDPECFALASAYGAVLRYAGAKVTDSACYEFLLGPPLNDESAFAAPKVKVAIDLLGILLLPKQMEEIVESFNVAMAAATESEKDGEGGEPDGEPPTGK